MLDPSSSAPPADFFATAASLGMLPAEEVEPLRAECESKGLTPAQFACDRGLLSGVEADIVETLASGRDIIPGYRVQGLIGKGGMGVVYRAEQRNLGRVVALKMILVSRMSDKGMLDRFELEARTIGQLRHPNIIAAHDFGRQAGRLYLAMELVEGTDLDQQIKSRGPLDEWQVWGLARQTAAGLAHACQHRIVHRDIKPANLMLVDPPEGYPLPPGLPMVKIADFGLALLQGDLEDRTRLTATDATLGSPHYMAPEQLESSDVDFRADMYALGATLFHALVGRPPFAGMKLSQLIAAKLGEGPAPIQEHRQDLEPSTRALIARLMARDPTERPGAYPELIDEIDAVVHSLQTTTLRVSGPTAQEAAATRIGPQSEPQFDPPAPESTTNKLHSVQTLTGQATATKAPTRRQSSLLPWAGLLAVVVAIAVAALWPDPPTESPGLPQRVPVETSGPARPLFNGVDTRGWTIGHGNWVYQTEDAVLQGRDGVISHTVPLIRSTTGEGRRLEPLRWYRLEMIFLPLPGSRDGGPDRSELELAGRGDVYAQELRFGCDGSGVDSQRYVLRRDREGVRLGEGTPAPGPSTDTVAEFARAVPAHASIALTLERLPTGWFIEIDGRPLGAVPLRPQEQPVFELRAEGEVHFAEALIYPLEPEADASSNGRDDGP